MTTTITGNVASAEVEHFSTTLSIFQSQNIHGEQSNLNGAIDVALDHFSNGVTTSKFIVLLSDGLTGTPISLNVLQKAKNKGVKIISFAIGNYSQGIANLKLLAYRTGGTYYGIGDYLHFASYYADLINIDIDSDSDGLPDYYESNIPIYNGNCIVTSPNIQDTDGDTLKDGEEIIIRKEYIPLTNQVRVYAKMLSDPREQDTDGDGIIDKFDRWESNNVWIENSSSDLRYKALNPLVKNTLENLYPEINKYNTESDAIYITLKENTINICAYVTLDSEDNMKDELFPNTNRTFQEALICGIESRWSKSIIGSMYDFAPGMEIDIITTIIPINNNFHNSLHIYLGRNGAVGHNNFNWKPWNIGSIEMYYKNNGHENYTIEYFEGAIAHEFGHCLGLYEAYLSSDTGKLLGNNSEICFSEGNDGLPDLGYDTPANWSNIMYYDGMVYANDIEMVLEAYVTGMRQYYLSRHCYLFERQGIKEPFMYSFQEKSGVIRENTVWR